MVYNKKNINFGCEFYLENKYFDSVIAEMKEIINETGLKLDGNILSNENKSVKIEYSEERQMYTLAVADITDGNVGEYREISSWLFDDTQTKKDAECVGMDFAETLRKEFGIASQKRSVNSLVDLHTAQKGDEANINAFTKKMLDVFPALKDEYKAHVAHYGNFLYLNFFGEHLAPATKLSLHSTSGIVPAVGGSDAAATGCQPTVPQRERISNKVLTNITPNR